MRKIFIHILLLLFFVDMGAQTNSYKIAQEDFNWGFRVGFNSKNANFHEIYQNGEETDRTKVTNQIGFQGTIFGRVNAGAFFVQPEVCYDFGREKYEFSILLNPYIEDVPEEEFKEPIFQDVIMNQKSLSINAAVLIGYNIVKYDSFLFNLYFGPNLRYNYSNKYNDLSTRNTFTDHTSYPKLNLLTGISANSFRVHFDFRYEINVPSKINFYFSDINSCPEYLKNISIKKNENILSFSIGIMF